MLTDFDEIAYTLAVFQPRRTEAISARLKGFAAAITNIVYERSELFPTCFSFLELIPFFFLSHSALFSLFVHSFDRLPRHQLERTQSEMKILLEFVSKLKRIAAAYGKCSLEIVAKLKRKHKRRGEFHSSPTSVPARSDYENQSTLIRPMNNKTSSK